MKLRRKMYIHTQRGNKHPKTPKPLKKKYIVIFNLNIPN